MVLTSFLGGKMLTDEINYFPNGGAAVQSAVILLHGYGADGHDLISMAPTLAQDLPNTVFYAPNAPQKEMNGYKWFDIDEMASASVYDRFLYIQALMEKALPNLPMINDFIEEIKLKHQLKDKQIALLGFSQGGLLTLMTGLMRPDQLAALVGCSAVPLAINSAMPLGKVISHPPVLLTHGEDDDVVPFIGMQMTQNTLADLNISVTTHTVPGMGHTIDESSVETVRHFLKKHLA